MAVGSIVQNLWWGWFGGMAAGPVTMRIKNKTYVANGIADTIRPFINRTSVIDLTIIEEEDRERFKKSVLNFQINGIIIN